MSSRTSTAVRIEGDWEAWLMFFLEGVEHTATQAASTARRLLDLAATDSARIQGIGKAAGTALRLHQLLLAHPIVSVSLAATRLGLSFPAINQSFERLQSIGIVREFTGQQRNRLFAYDACLKILSEGTETGRQPFSP